MPATITPEEQRLAEANERRQAWRKWGPYVSERQWGTVREDYSADGDAWNYFPHDHARSRAYRWGEDGIGGFCDAKQRLCMAVALWNGKDPILKERMFGLSNREGNHGEDVKELYYYLDAVPTYSYARMLYKYPQAAFPYDLLVQENARRDRQQPEFEIIDTGIFDDDRYFDVDIEYAKAGADDILLRLTVTNRGPEEAAIHVLPQVWFRNTWSWFTDRPKPSLERAGDDVVVKHETLGAYAIHFDRPDEIKFCENETNVAKLYGSEDTGRLYKDGFHDYRGGRRQGRGRFAQGHQGGRHLPADRRGGRQHDHPGQAEPGPAQARTLRRFRADLRPAQIRGGCLLRRAAEQGAGRGSPPHSTPGFRGHPVVEAIFLLRRHGMARRRPGATQARPAPAIGGRNSEWVHATMEDVVSMPDKWEFPWFAAWDWAFHLVTLAYLDLEDAKHQLILLGQSWYMHPERAAARLRMELQRRQSARAGLGGAAPLR